MTKVLALAVLTLPTLAAAQTAEPQPPPPLSVAPVAAPIHAAVPILPNWSLGAGLGFVVSGLGYSSSMGSLQGLAGLAGTGSFALGASRQPRFTVLIERRSSERLFLTFQAAASYGTTQDDTNAELKGHQLNLEGALGLRRVFNPGGVIEVSWFGNAGVGYTNGEYRALTSLYDQTTGTFSSTALTIFRGHTFSVGAVTGLTLERQLLEGLSLRLSSSIVGLSYGLGATTTTTPETRTDRQNHQFDVGLRFSPSIELRYAF